MLKLFEWMVQPYIDTIDKYLTDNNYRAGYLRLFFMRNEYELCQEKRKEALALKQELRNIYAHLYRDTIKSESEESETSLRAHSSSEDLGNNILASPPLRARSAELAVITSKLSTPQSEVSYSTKRLRELANNVSATNSEAGAYSAVGFVACSTISANIEHVDYARGLISNTEEHKKTLARARSKHNDHAKGSLEDLLTVIRGNINYTFSREERFFTRYNSYILEMEKTKGLDRDYSWHLTQVIERLLCFIAFDTQLFLRKHCSNAQKNRYSVSDVFKKVDRTIIRNVEHKLEEIAEDIYSIPESILNAAQPNKDLYIKIREDYDAVLQQLKHLSGSEVIKFKNSVTEYKVALGVEFKNKFNMSIEEAAKESAVKPSTHMQQLPLNNCAAVTLRLR